eukprot:6975447-Alexandrium_andersonii.AAC.1
MPAGLRCRAPNLHLGQYGWRVLWLALALTAARGLPAAPSLGCQAVEERIVAPSQWAIARA